MKWILIWYAVEGFNCNHGYWMAVERFQTQHECEAVGEHLDNHYYSGKDSHECIEVK